MSSKTQRSRLLETAISIAILTVLALVIAAVLIKQSHYSLSRYGFELGAEQANASAKPAIPISFDKLTADGFQPLSTPQTYTTETLYEKIDGKAPLYTEAGFKILYTQRYVSSTTADLWAEIYLYDMAEPANAFSVFSIQRRPDVQPIEGVTPYLGYRTTNSLFFCHGRYYIEFIGAAESAALLDAMVKIAENLRNSIAVSAQPSVPELEILTAKDSGFVEGSSGFYITNAFSFAKFDNIYTAKFLSGSSEVTVFLSKRSSPQQAKDLADQYSSFMIENGATAASQKDPAADILDFYGDSEIVFSVDSFLAGVHAAADPNSAKNAADHLKNKINEVLKK